MKRIVFSDYELEVLPGQPGALRALADHHMVKAIEADASDFPGAVRFHENRRKELLDTAAFIEEAWENGDPPEYEEG